MKNMRKITALLLALALVLGLSGCGGEAQPFTVRVDLPQQVSTLDPAMVTNDAERTVVSHLYENLMKLSNDGQGRAKVVSGLAAGYQCENNLDGTQTYTFSLRPGITWSDGKTVTAGDFVYAWQRLADPATESPNAALLSKVAGYASARKSGDMTKLQVTAADDQTLVVVLSKPCLYFAEVICTHAATMPVRSDAPEGTVLANGPYRIVKEWQDGAVTLAADANYHDARRLGPEELHFTCGAAAEETDFRLTYDKVEEEDLWTMAPVAQTGTLVINQMASLSEELRQAMSLTIDRAEVAEILGSNYTAAAGLIPHGIRNTKGEEYRLAVGAMIDNDPESYESRCEAARELLKGQTLPAIGNVSLLYVSDAATDQVALALRTTWQQTLGLTVMLRAVTLEEMQEAIDKGEFSMALVMMTSEQNDASAMLQDWTSKASENYANISNSAYDLLMRIADASTSVEARDAYLGDAERMLLESGYVMPICFVAGSWQLNDDLTGVFSDGFGRYFFSGVTERAK